MLGHQPDQRTNRGGIDAAYNPGTNSWRRLPTLDIMFAPHYQPDPRIPGNGLAGNRGTEYPGRGRRRPPAPEDGPPATG